MCKNCGGDPCNCKIAMGQNENPNGKKQKYFKEHTKIKSRTNGKEYEIQFGPQPKGLVPSNPFASLAQAGYMHSHPEILGKAGLKEWDAASKGKHLPKHVK